MAIVPVTARTMFDLQNRSTSENVRLWNLQEIFIEDAVAHTHDKTLILPDNNDLSTVCALSITQNMISRAEFEGQNG